MYESMTFSFSDFFQLITFFNSQIDHQRKKHLLPLSVSQRLKSLSVFWRIMVIKKLSFFYTMSHAGENIVPKSIKK